MTDRPLEAADQGLAVSAEWEDLSEAHLEPIQALLATFTKALRAYQLYDENNPVYQRFVTNLRNAFREIWVELDKLPLHVEEERLAYHGQEVYRSDSRTDSLAFLLYKDGIREITFLPGIEDEEVEPLLNALQRARHLRAEGDDLLTILWDADLQLFRHTYIDLLAEGLEVPEAQAPGFTDFGLVLEGEVGEEAEEGSEEEGEAASIAQPTISREDFNPTLYSLDPREMERIHAELDKEKRRDLRGDVLDALFDRLEEPESPERQSEILSIIETLLSNFLSHGALDAAGAVLEELSKLRVADGILDPARQAEADHIVDALSLPASVQELVRALEDGAITPRARELGAFLRHLHAGALGPLVRASELLEKKELQPVLREAVQGIAEANRPAVLDLLGSGDPAIMAGAARLAGRLRLTDAAPAILQLLKHSDAGVRMAAVDSAVGLRAPTVTGQLQEGLSDPDREVRIATAKGLAELKYLPAATAFRNVLKGKRIRQADLTEKIALFESYGVMGDKQATQILDRLLNGRGFLGRKEEPEIRACAALALGRVRTPEASAALEAAREETQPIVRNAVSRALRGEG